VGNREEPLNPLEGSPRCLTPVTFFAMNEQTKTSSSAAPCPFPKTIDHFQINVTLALLGNHDHIPQSLVEAQSP
jgi:hypothetical protein